MNANNSGSRRGQEAMQSSVSTVIYNDSAFGKYVYPIGEPDKISYHIPNIRSRKIATMTIPSITDCPEGVVIVDEFHLIEFEEGLPEEPEKKYRIFCVVKVPEHSRFGSYTSISPKERRERESKWEEGTLLTKDEVAAYFTEFAEALGWECSHRETYFEDKDVPLITMTEVHLIVQEKCKLCATPVGERLYLVAEVVAFE